MTKIKDKVFKSPRSVVFYVGLMAIPVLQFVVFYIIVNFNSFLMAFQNIRSVRVGDFSWTFEHFTKWFSLSGDRTELLNALKISIKSYLITLCVSVPLGLFFSYYIFKKMPGAMIFRFMLFLPSIIMSIVLVTIYQNFTDYAVQAMRVKWFHVDELTDPLLTSDKTRYATIMIYNLFVGFGTTVLMYSNKMANISPDVIEAAELDGANSFQEFFRIVLPQTFSVVSVFLVTGVASIFTNQINNFSFFEYTVNPDTATVGFLMYKRLENAQGDVTKYPPIAALGLMTTVVAIPVTFLVRWLLEKFGPSED